MGSGKTRATTAGTEAVAVNRGGRILNRKTVAIAAPLIGIAAVLLSRRVRGGAVSRLDKLAAALGFGTQAQQKTPAVSTGTLPPPAVGAHSAPEDCELPAAHERHSAPEERETPAAPAAQPEPARRKRGAAAPDTPRAARKGATSPAADVKPDARRGKTAPAAAAPAKPRSARRKAAVTASDDSVAR